MKTKRILALLLTVVMSVGVLSFGAAAELSTADTAVMQYIKSVSAEHYEIAQKQGNALLAIDFQANVNDRELTNEEIYEIIGEDFTTGGEDEDKISVSFRKTTRYSLGSYFDENGVFSVHYQQGYTVKVGGNSNKAFNSYKLLLRLKESEMVTVLKFYDMTNQAEFDVSAALAERIIGDVNDDTFINAKDILLLRKYLAKWDVVINARNSDANMDNRIDARDVRVIMGFRAYINELG